METMGRVVVRRALAACDLAAVPLIPGGRVGQSSSAGAIPTRLEIAARTAGSEMPWKSSRAVYGASSVSISSSLRSMSRDAIASDRCVAFVAPTSGAVTIGLERSQASATWACETPRASAMAPTAPMIARSLAACV
jgi:hypothetical protein